MTDEIDKSLGQRAFEAYRAEVVTAFNGDPIPPWDALDSGAAARRGWEAAAQAVAQHVRMMAALDKAMEGRFVRRERPQRWRPFADSLPIEVDDTEAVRAGLLEPVGDDEARAAAASVPVVAEEEDGRDGGLSAP